MERFTPHHQKAAGVNPWMDRRIIPKSDALMPWLLSRGAGFTKNEQGLSLIEVLAGVTILAVALIPIMVMFSTGISGTMRTTYRNLATNLAQQKMEEIRNLTWNQSTDQIPLGTWYTAPGESVQSGNKSLSRQVLVEKAVVDGQERNDIRKITVTVSWTISGDTKSISLATYRFKGI